MSQEPDLLKMLATAENAEMAGEWADGEHIDIFTPIRVRLLIERVVRAEHKLAQSDLNFDEADSAKINAEGREGQALERLEQAEQRVARVRELHTEYVISEWDEEANNPKVDANGKQIVLARLCRGCSSDDSIAAAEDAEWDDSYEDVEYPCPTIRALDGEPNE